jgi:phosphoribosylformimino-5-aminoimidazole carboxamide ribotide isomerase
MLAIPAIDLREGRCVQLVGGDYAAEAIRLEDPIAVAHRWIATGFARLHVVDLDAATRRGDHLDLITRLVMEVEVPVQVGGGIRTEERVSALLEAGSDAVIIGTRGLADPEWLRAQALRAPGQVILAADVRDGEVVAEGWAAGSGRSLREAIAAVHDAPLAGLLVTAVHREGRMAGTDLALMEEAVAASPWPVHASGGVGSMEDLRALAGIGVQAVVLGMGLYTGTLDAAAVAAEFGR